MKKRNLILISSILCVILTVSLVTYALVGVFKKTETTEPAGDIPIVDTTTNPGDLASDEISVNLIVDSKYEGSVLTKENYTGVLLVANSSGELIATNTGNEKVSVQNAGVIYTVSVSVYEKGEGTQENPYNVVSAKDLQDLSKSTCGEYTYFIQRCDLDLSGFDSWDSIGSLTSPFFGSYDGGNYAIKNMSIVITPENAENYIDNAQTAGGSNGTMLTAGFFGFVGSPTGEAVSEIKNVNIHSAKIDTSSIETEEQLAEIELTQSYIGVLAGYVAYTNVSGGLVTANINSSLYCDDTTSTRGAVSAFVGGAIRSDLSGATIRANITANNPGTVEVNENGAAFYGTTVVGILGRNNTTNVKDMSVTLSVSAKNYENMVVSGGIGYIVTPTNGGETLIENITIDNLYVNISEYSYVSTKTSTVAGVVASNFDVNTTIKNVTVNNAIVNAIGRAQVSGIIDTNKGTLINPTISGLFKGTYVYGVANRNFGKILWTEDYNNLNAVDVTLKGQIEASGLVGENGSGAEVSGSAALTQVKATINWSIVRKDFDKIKESAMIAGLAIKNSGTIQNFYTNTNLIDVVNAGGAVGIMNGGTLKNVNINTTIRTIAGEVGVETYSGKSNVIGGIVAIVAKDSTNNVLEDVRGNITVNNTSKINTQNLYGLNYYGTIIGIAEGEVMITSNNASYKINASVFTNYKSAEKQYIGKVVGFASAETVQFVKNVKVAIAIKQTAENAIIADVNK